MTGSESRSRRSRPAWLREAGSFCLYMAIAVFASWPLCRSPASTISIGFEAEATVPLLNVWTLWWNSDRLAAGFTDYWNAPIFYPTQRTFAFSEAQPTMLFVAPVVWLTGSRVLAYNVYFLLILSLNGWSSQRLLRRIGHQPWLAFCGGVMCQMLPFVWWQSGVVQLMTVFGIVWTVHSLLNVFDPPTNTVRGATWEDMASIVRAFRGLFSRSVQASLEAIRGDETSCSSNTEHWRQIDWRDSSLRGLKLGGSFCVTYLLCNYWGMFLVLVLVPSSIWLWNVSVIRLRFWFEICLAALVALVVLAPMVSVQKSLAMKHQWTREQSLIRDLSAHPSYFLDTPRTPPPRDFTAKLEPGQKPADALGDERIAWSRLPRRGSAEQEREIVWPLGGGILKLALAQFGLVAALVTRGRRRWGLFAATFAAVSFGLSLGPTVWIAPWVPLLNGLCSYEWLQQHVPGFALIRSPFRFALFFQLAIVWLCVEGLDLLNPGRWRRMPDCDDALEQGMGGRGSRRAAASVESPIVNPGSAGASPSQTTAIASEIAANVGHPNPADQPADADQPTVADEDRSGGWTALHPSSLNPPPAIGSKFLQWWLMVPMILQSLILVCEVWPPRQSIYTCPSATTAPAWILWLRENSDPHDAVICLPFPTGYTVHDYQETAEWMYWGTMHRRPLVNGYSGFFPQDFVDLKEKLAYFHRPEGDTVGIPQLKKYPHNDSPGLIEMNKWNARFAVVKRSFATRDDVWQHPVTQYRWAWVTADEQHQLDIYEIQPEGPE